MIERDFYVFRNHTFKTYFEPNNSSQKDRYHANKTFSSNSCLIHMTSSRLRKNGSNYVLFSWFRKFWETESFKICLTHMISKYIKITFTSKVYYFMGQNFQILILFFSGIKSEMYLFSTKEKFFSFYRTLIWIVDYGLKIQWTKKFSHISISICFKIWCFLYLNTEI